MNVYPFIEAEKVQQRTLKRACELLEVSRAARYRWRPPWRATSRLMLDGARWSRPGDPAKRGALGQAAGDLLSFGDREHAW